MIHETQQHHHRPQEPATQWLPAAEALGELTSSGLNAMFRRPQRIGKPSGWWAHVPFAAWVVEACEPQLLVELGTHHGVSYAAFCEAVLRAGLPTRCYAIDHWRGDAHAGAYDDAVHSDLHAFNQQHYAAFSELIRSDFDAAVDSFEDGSIDLLHIDGFHTYEAVRHDYETWRRKLSPRAVLLFHDTNVRQGDFGVHRLFGELARTAPHFEFLHGHGLGVIAHGAQAPAAVRQLCAAASGQGTLAIRDRFATLGAIWAGVARESEAQRSFQLQVQALQEHQKGLAAEHARALVLAERARDAALGRVQLLQERIEEAARRPEQDSPRNDRPDAAEQAMAHAARRMADMSNEIARLQAQASQHDLGRSALLEQLEQARTHHADATKWLDAAALEREALLAHQSQLESHAQRFAAQISQLVPDLLRRHGELVQVTPPAVEGGLAGAGWNAARWLRRNIPSPLRAPFRFLAPALRRLAARRHPVASVVRQSLLFDARWYLSRYADVAASGQDAAYHYAVVGGAEGHDPSPWFSTRSYLRSHPDVARSGVNALYHYERQGRLEGRAVAWVDAAAIAPHPAHAPIAVNGNDQAREDYRAHSAKALRAFLDDADARIVLRSTPTHPLVSVILVLHNHAELTFRCLQSLALLAQTSFEVIVVDNASSDLTGELLARVDGVRVLRQAQNLHFLMGANTGAREAHGRHLLFLNNDTQVDAGALDAASRVLDAEADVGAVGARIVLLDGRLQEAGAIVWRDGSCSGFGRGEDPDDAAYRFRRDVDYCSGAFLMVRRQVFESLAGFDPLYAPAYYEDTDLCMRMRAAGWRVVYEPDARIVHFETGSAPSADSAVQLMRSNRLLFVQRHAAVLQETHRPPSEGTLVARARPPSGARVLFIDDQLPLPSLGAGNPRACRLLHELAQAGCFVTHYPLASPLADLAAAARVLPAGLEAIVGQTRPTLEELLHTRTGYYDMVLVSRPHNAKRFLAQCDRQAPKFLASTRLVYDAEAIFALRESLRREVLGLADDARHEDELRLEDELALARRAATVLAVSEAEAQRLRDAGCPDVRVLDHALAPEPTPASFDQRRDILFVGRLEEEDSPNADSVRWFVREVMPQLDRLIGSDWQLQLVGGCAPALRAQLQSPRVRFHGRVDDLAACHDAARLFIAPTRFAAGVPHKVHGAAAYGLPAVVTALIGDQLGWPDGDALLVGQSAAGFANACARLYQDPDLWERLRAGALAHVARACDPAVFRETVRKLLHAKEAAQAPAPSTQADRAATARAWSTPPQERAREQGQFWMEHPMVAARLNHLATGNADLHALPYLMQTLRAQGWRFPVPRIASLGCGFGGLERELAALGIARRIDAYDIAESALDEARRLARAAGLDHLHYHLSDLESQPLPEGAFDVVFACHSVHHIAGLDALFANVRRALRPGGIFHVQEYIGPDRFQWTDAQLRGINEFQDSLPRRLRMLPNGIERGHVGRPTVAEVMAVDPSEAVCSSQIADALGRHFRVQERRDLGGALLHMGLSGIAQNFDAGHADDRAHLQRLFDMEDLWMHQGRIGSDFAILVATRD